MAELLKDHSEERARHRHEPTQAHEPLPRYHSTTTAHSSDGETAAPTQGGAGATQAPSVGVPEGDILPGMHLDPRSVNPADDEQAKTVTLYIGSRSDHYRRAMTGWTCMDKDEWTERMEFKVFKYEEVGTIRVEVRDNRDSHRSMVNTSRQGGIPVLPSMRMASRARERAIYGFLFGRTRIFLNGTQGDCLDGWERILKSCVPQ